MGSLCSYHCGASSTGRGPCMYSKCQDSEQGSGVVMQCRHPARDPAEDSKGASQLGCYSYSCCGCTKIHHVDIESGKKRISKEEKDDSVKRKK